jgi:alkylation response protein AidB-like acyl-CoA dehydrogenase
MAVEELAKASAAVALILTVQELGTLPIRLFGTDEQKERWLPRCASGEWSPAFCLSEPEAGSRPRRHAHHRQRGDSWPSRVKGLSIALATLERTRLGAAAQAVGIAQGAIDYATSYARERIAFGKPLTEIQAIQFKLADMQTKTAAARELLYKACVLADRGAPEAAQYSSMAKLFASDTAMEVTVEAVQILGGYGYVRDYPVERMMRDAKITQIYEGTNEIQRLVIAREMTR